MDQDYNIYNSSPIPELNQSFEDLEALNEFIRTFYRLNYGYSLILGILV